MATLLSQVLSGANLLKASNGQEVTRRSPSYFSTLRRAMPLGLPTATTGAAPLTFTVSYTAPSSIVITFSRNIYSYGNLANFSIVAPAGAPAVTVTAIAQTAANQLTLTVSSGPLQGGTYTLTVAAGAARAVDDGGANA